MIRSHILPKSALILGCAALMSGVCVPFAGIGKKNPDLAAINLPAGFKIEVFAQDIENARSMVLGDKGTLFVSTRKAGKVYAVVDTNGDHKGDAVYVLAKGLNMPNGVAFLDGDLYVAEVNRILRFRNIESSLSNPGDPEVVFDGYPSDKHHGWKYIAFGPDGRLYIPVGAPCNICKSEDPIYASITSIKPDGSDLQIHAHGVRNTVGFDWHPETGDLWFTDNGRDWMGDDMPPCELNRLAEDGEHFGYPYCHGGIYLDDEFGKDADCSKFSAPVQNLGPHVAPLGMLFYTGNQFPEAYRNQVLIAEHGSWNRSTPIGYRVTLVTLDGNKSTGYEVFADGWLSGNTTSGRPVDIIHWKDGSVLVSDDYANKIYRISYAR